VKNKRIFLWASTKTAPAQEYRIVYDAGSEAAHALREYLGDNLKSGETAFTLRASGKTELNADRPGGRSA